MYIRGKELCEEYNIYLNDTLQEHVVAATDDIPDNPAVEPNTVCLLQVDYRTGEFIPAEGQSYNGLATIICRGKVRIEPKFSERAVADNLVKLEGPDYGEHSYWVVGVLEFKMQGRLPISTVRKVPYFDCEELKSCGSVYIYETHCPECGPCKITLHSQFYHPTILPIYLYIDNPQVILKNNGFGDNSLHAHDNLAVNKAVDFRLGPSSTELDYLIRDLVLSNLCRLSMVMSTNP